MPRIILKINNENTILPISEQVCCYMADSRLSAEMFQRLIQSGKMVLSFGDNAYEVCRQYNLDGVVVIIDSSKPVKIQLKPLREKLKNKTLGVIIPPRRHEAMLAGEVEPEFVAFRLQDYASSKELIEWYNDLFLLPLALDFSASDKPIPPEWDDFVIIDAKKFSDSGC